MLVVGAGPAGAELGRCLAKAGVDVCVIDRLPDLEAGGLQQCCHADGSC